MEFEFNKCSHDSIPTKYPFNDNACRCDQKPGKGRKMQDTTGLYGNRNTGENYVFVCVQHSVKLNKKDREKNAMASNSPCIFIFGIASQQTRTHSIVSDFSFSLSLSFWLFLSHIRCHHSIQINKKYNRTKYHIESKCISGGVVAQWKRWTN